MAVYYNENGDLQNFEEWRSLQVCSDCAKRYEQTQVEQVPGFRDRSDDVCPYCGHVNGSSMKVEFYNGVIS